MVANTFAPQHNQRVPRGTALISKRLPLIAADKKKVNKASIGLPIFRTLKLATENCFPFILNNCVPLEAIQRNLGQIINNRNDSGLNTVSEARRPRLALNAVQQRISLGGTTLYSVAEQAPFSVPQELRQGPSEDFQNQPQDQTQNQPTRDNDPLQISVRSHASNYWTQLTVRVDAWLKDVITPTELEFPSLATQLEASAFFSRRDLSEDDWNVIERVCRQRKSPLRRVPNIMSSETNDNSFRGSNNTRPSASYSGSVRSHTRTTTSAIKDHPGTSVRRPKSMPSGSQLPSCWNDDMDKFICHMEAQGGFGNKTIIKALKQRFVELREVGTAFISL